MQHQGNLGNSSQTHKPCPNSVNRELGTLVQLKTELLQPTQQPTRQLHQHKQRGWRDRIHTQVLQGQGAHRCCSTCESQEFGILSRRQLQVCQSLEVCK